MIKKDYEQNVMEIANVLDDMENPDAYQLSVFIIEKQKEAVENWISFKNSLAGPEENQDRVSAYMVDSGLVSTLFPGAYQREC